MMIEYGQDENDDNDDDDQDDNDKDENIDDNWQLTSLMLTVPYTLPCVAIALLWTLFWSY